MTKFTIQQVIKNPFLQIAIPMLLAAIILGIIMVKRRYIHLKSVATMFGVAAITVVFLVIGVKDICKVSTTVQEEGPAEINQYLVNELLRNNCFDSADKLLEILQDNPEESAEATLVHARIETLKENFRAADALYMKAKENYEKQKISNFPDDEALLIHSFVENLDVKQEATAIVTYLKEQNLEPSAYGYVDVANKTPVSSDQIINTVKSNLEDTQEVLQDSDPDYVFFSDLGKYIVDIDTMYEQYLSDGSYDMDQVKRSKRHLTTVIEEHPYLIHNKYIRLSRLKAMVLTGSYAEIAETADEYLSTEELMIISELYLQGYIKEDDFNCDYSTVDTKKLEVVLEQCNKIYEQEDVQNAGSNIRKTYRSNLKFLEESLDKQNLVTTMNYLQSNMDSVNPALKSKAYLQLSKLAQHFEVEDRASVYLDASLNTVGDVDDMEYAQPMSELVGIVNGKSEDDSVKNIVTYVEQVLDHSLPIQLVDGIEPEKSNSKEESNLDQDSSQKESGNPKQTFEQFFTNTISKKTATINIGFIDKSMFPKVSAKIQVSSDNINNVEDFKNQIMLSDCHRKVDYEVEKLNYHKSQIILLVDVSGSMSDSVDSLRNAVKSFGNHLNANEEVRVIAFTDHIQSDTGFLTNAAEVENAADQLYANGGTALYTSLLQVGGNFSNDVNCNNVIICMTDGEDNNPASEADIFTEVSKLCANNNCTVYTLGLGSSVDTTYLKNIADAGQGSFLYINEAASIDSFFDFVHNQADNQYIVRFDAKDQITNKRVLKAQLTEESIEKEKMYYLVDPEYSENEDQLEEDILTQSTFHVNGLKAKAIYKSGVDVTNQLIGSNFTKDAEITVSIKGLISYDLPATYVDDSTYEITIPYGISPGSYDLEVLINDEFFKLSNELSILVPGTEKSFTFGDYTFTCDNSEQDDYGDCILTGNVTMNGWLHFKGDVVLSGDFENSDRITVYDAYGSYIPYTSLKSKSGLAKFMAQKGISVPLPAFGSFQIYKEEYDPSNYKDFHVEDVYECNLVNIQFLLIENPKVSVYPDMLYLKNASINFDMPFQKALLGSEFNEDLKSLDYGTGIILAATDIGLKANIEYEIPEKKEFRMSTLPLTLKEAKLDIDTFANNYEIMAKVAFKSLPVMEALGCSFAVKDGRFDGLGLYADTRKAVTLQVAPIPITMNDFGIKISGLSSQEKVDLAYILGLTLSAKFDVNVADVEAVLPAVASFLEYEPGNPPCVVQFDDCTFEMTLAELEFAFNSKLKFLGMYEFGEVEANLGKFNYSNELLNLRSITEYGLRAKLKLGHKWETTNYMLDLNGSIELVAGYPYFGVHGAVKGDFEVSWFIFSADFDVSGDLLIGFVENAYQELQFNAILRGGKNGDYTGFRAYASASEGFNVDLYK